MRAVTFFFGNALQDFRHGFLDTYFVIAHDGPYVFGLDNVADPASIRAGLGRIAGSLDSD